MLGDLDRALDAVVEMALHHRRSLGIDGVQGVDAEQLLDLRVARLAALGSHCSAPAGSTPRSARLMRSRPRPERMWLFTVPSGSSSISATSR